MQFTNRVEAGALLARKLKKYYGMNTVVYGIPRGGVVCGIEIAKYLNALFDIVVTRKIGHPNNSEYAIAAVSENGMVIINRNESVTVDEDWLKREIEKEHQLAISRRKIYSSTEYISSPENKIVILVDDGVATGLTMRVAISELKYRNPKKIIVAVPVVSRSTADILIREVEELVALLIPTDDIYLGSVGAYYDDFKQITDEEIINLLKQYKEHFKKNKTEEGDFL